jgi:Single-strand binding protein family
VVSEWATVKAPPAPELKTVTVNPKTTALLVMDFNEGLCSPGGQYALPRRIRAIPKVKELLEIVRAHHMLVVFTGYPNMQPIVKALVRMHNGPMVVSHADKFDNSILKDHGITTVITSGLVGNGAALTVLSVATQRSWKNAEEEWASKTEWHRVVAWNSLGEQVATSLRQGSHFLVEGTLEPIIPSSRP